MRPMISRALSLALRALMLTTSAAPAAEPIKVGYMGPLTGIFAQAGKDMLDGLKMGVESAGGQAAGRKIEIVEEDNEGNPASAQTKYRKLVQQDKIHVLAGVLLANIGYALAFVGVVGAAVCAYPLFVKPNAEKKTVALAPRPLFVIVPASAGSGATGAMSLRF